MRAGAKRAHQKWGMELGALALVLCLLLGVTPAEGAWAQVPSVGLEAGLGADGKTVTVTISVTADPLCALQMTVVYDSALLVAAAPPKLEAPWAASLASTHVATPGKAVLALVSAGGIASTGEAVATLTLTVPQGVAGVAQLYLQDIVMIGKDGTSQTVGFAAPLQLAVGQGAVPGTQAQPGTIVLKDGEERLRDTVLLQVDNYAAVVDGVLVPLDPEDRRVVPIVTTDHRTLVPLRFLAQALRATVAWDGATQRITLTRGARVVELTVGQRGYTVDGVAHEMDAPPMVQNQRTLVPTRVLAEAFGAAVTWDGTRQLVILAPLDRPWALGGVAEEDAAHQALSLLSPPLRDFI